MKQKTNFFQILSKDQFQILKENYNSKILEQWSNGSVNPSVQEYKQIVSLLNMSMNDIANLYNVPIQFVHKCRKSLSIYENQKKISENEYKYLLSIYGQSSVIIQEFVYESSHLIYSIIYTGQIMNNNIFNVHNYLDSFKNSLPIFPFFEYTTHNSDISSDRQILNDNSGIDTIYYQNTKIAQFQFKGISIY